MARRPRNTDPRFLHHVIVRGNNRRRLFSYKSDYIRFQNDLASARERTGTVGHQLTILDNHVHQIVAIPSPGALPAFVKHLCQNYAQYRNRKRDGSGKLFEQRYYSEPLITERHLIAAFLYNDANAYRAGIVSDPAAHRWSTCGFHCGRADLVELRRELWTPSEWYLSLGSDAEQRAAAYRELLADYLARPVAPNSKAQEFEYRAMMRSTRRLERPDRSRAGEPPLAYRIRSAKSHDER